MAGRGSKHRTRHGRNARRSRALEGQLISRHIAKNGLTRLPPSGPPEEEAEEPRRKPGLFKSVPNYRIPAEQIWRTNLAQYYAGWITQRPEPRGLTERRANEILREVYTKLPQKHIVPHLRRQRRAPSPASG